MTTHLTDKEYERLWGSKIPAPEDSRNLWANTPVFALA
jgi:hypothetical protein